MKTKILEATKNGLSLNAIYGILTKNGYTYNRIRGLKLTFEKNI